MSEYDWRNAAAYAYMRDHDAEAFSREYLSRNEAFHREYMAAVDAGGEVTEAFAEKWGIRFRRHEGNPEGTRLLDPRRLPACAASRADDATPAPRAHSTLTPDRSRLPGRRR